MDQTFPFVAGTVYKYIERQQDDTISETEFTVGSDTTTATIAVAPFDADPRGNPFVVGVASELTDLWLVTGIGQVQPDNSRRIEGVRYLDEIYSDEAPPETTGFLQPTFSGAPADVTGAGVVETVLNNKTSRLTVSWTASAGSPAAVRYIVWFKANGSPFAQMGSTTGTSIVDNFTYDTGTPVTFAIQPVAADGSRDALTLVTQVTYVIHRSGGNLIVFPATMTGLQIVPGSGNDADLEWDTLANVDGYEIRIGSWHEGVLIYRGTSTSVAIKLNDLSQKYYARAYNTIGGTRYYSPVHATVDSTPTNLTGYTTLESSNDIDFTTEAFLANFQVVPWVEVNDTNAAALQISRDGIATIEGPTVDLGSVANTHTSVDIRMHPYQITPGDDLSPAMEHVSPYGEINRQYLDWKLYLEYSNTGASYQRKRVDDDLNDDIITNSRYFRPVLESRLVRQSDLAAQYPCLAQCVRLAITHYRA